MVMGMTDGAGRLVFLVRILAIRWFAYFGRQDNVHFLWSTRICRISNHIRKS